MKPLALLEGGLFPEEVECGVKRPIVGALKAYDGSLILYVESECGYKIETLSLPPGEWSLRDAPGASAWTRTSTLPPWVQKGRSRTG